jgi:hypothetical protein
MDIKSKINSDDLICASYALNFYVRQICSLCVIVLEKKSKLANHFDLGTAPPLTSLERIKFSLVFELTGLPSQAKSARSDSRVGSRTISN